MLYIDHENPVFYVYPREYHYEYDITLIDMMVKESIIRLENVETISYSRGVVGIGLDIDLKPNRRYYIKIYHPDKGLMFNGVVSTGVFKYDNYNDYIQNNDFIEL